MLPASGRRALHSQARPRLPLNAFSTAAIPSCGHQQPHAIQRLRVISDSSSSTAVSAEAAPLLEWMHQRGCTINGVQLVYQHNAGRLSRELQASKDLSPGDVLMIVPLDCTVHYIDHQQQPPGNNQNLSPSNITSSSSSSDSSSSSSGSSSSSREALRRLQANVPAASDSGRGAWQFKMALEILYHYHQGPDSPLHPYIQTLPGVQPGIPGPQVAMLYPEAQLQELQYGPLIADAGGQIHWWKSYSQEVLSKVPGTADDAFGGRVVSQEQLGWALSIAMSRAFGFKRLGGWALVPLVDMANHSFTSNAEIRCDEGGTVRMIANKQVTAGSAIYLKYGNHDNANLLLSYGFVLPDNPADRFRMPLDLDIVLSAIYQFVGGELPPTGRAVDGLKTWQRTTLKQLGLLHHDSAASAAGSDSSSSNSSSSSSSGVEGQAGQQQVVISIGGDPPVSEALLAAVRVVLATDRSMVKGKSLQQLGDWSQPIETMHEALVLKALVGLCTVLYKSFPTTIQADKAFLAEQQQQQQHAADEQRRLEAERLQTAVQFRLGLKLLLEQSSKALLMRLKALLQ